jgi:hypothetical protein
VTTLAENISGFTMTFLFILGLFYYVSVSENTSPNDMTINEQFELLSGHLFGVTQENQENLSTAGGLTTRPRW